MDREVGHGVRQAGLLADLAIVGPLEAHPEGGHVSRMAVELEEALVEEPVGPRPACQRLGRLGGLDLPRVVALAAGEIEREDGGAATALLPRLLLLPVGEEIVERSQEERAEPSAGRVGLLDRAALDQVGDELLDEVLRGLVVHPAAAHIKVERFPVEADERIPPFPLAEGADQAPGGFDELLGRAEDVGIGAHMGGDNVSEAPRRCDSD